ncbi:hypothetical protein TNCV_3082781 [Trichonephila clavipes]|nr:hypothetical protein TNCV_3082781 [Trichonephila clavipes]
MVPWARRLGGVLALDKCVQMWTRNYGALGQTARVCFGVLCANRTREVMRDFGDLPIRRSEGRVVNTPLVFKRVLFEGKKGQKGKGQESPGERKKKKEQEKGQESPAERTNGRRRKDGKEKEETERESGRERESDARLEWRKGLSKEIGVKKTMNAGGVEKEI